MLSPDISVVIPTYNRISMLEEALASVLSQDFDGTVEIIVVDDNSQDRTSEMVSQKYPHIHLISLKHNVGAYVARNLAISETRGKYIAFLDSDDLWEKNYLISQIEALKGKERCFSVSALVTWNTVENCKWVDIQKPDIKKYNSPFHHLLVEGSFIFTPSSVIFPRQVFDELGLFDETYRYGGDTELYIRCLLGGYQAIFTELPVAIRRIHGKGQATDAKNIEIRKESRIARANKFYHLIQKQFDIVPLRQIYAGIDTTFAKQYLIEKKILCWLKLSLKSAYNASPGYALYNMMLDLRCLLKIGTRLKMMGYSFKEWFHIAN